MAKLKYRHAVLVQMHLVEMSSLTNEALGNLPRSQRTMLIFAFCYNL